MGLSKREQTRRHISAQAYALFEAQGYDNTTVAQIAKSAGVSHMTFFRNFPTRAHVLISGIDIPLLIRLVSSAPLHMGALECLCWTFLKFIRVVDGRSRDKVRRHLLVVANSDGLGSEMFGPNSVLMHRIASALAGRGVGEWEARTVTCAVLGGIGGALNQWADFDSETDLVYLSDVVAKALLPDVNARDRVYRDLQGETTILG